MKDQKEDKRSFNVVIPKELWVYLKMVAAKKETSMGSIIEKLIVKMKEKNDKKDLTCRNTNV